MLGRVRSISGDLISSAPVRGRSGVSCAARRKLIVIQLITSTACMFVCMPVSISGGGLCILLKCAINLGIDLKDPFLLSCERVNSTIATDHCKIFEYSSTKNYNY